jgi:hypothetical protein
MKAIVSDAREVLWVALEQVDREASRLEETRTSGAGRDLHQGRIPPELTGGEHVDAVLAQVGLRSGGIDGLTLIDQVERLSSGPSTASGWLW